MLILYCAMWCKKDVHMLLYILYSVGLVQSKVKSKKNLLKTRG